MARPSAQALIDAARRIVPFLVTAVAGAALALALQPTPPAPLAPTSVPTAVAQLPTSTPTLPPPEPTPIPSTPTAVVLPGDTVSLRIVQLEQSLRQVNGNLLLLQAASRFQSARLALRDNQPEEVLRQLAVGQEELDLAAQLMPDNLKGPIQDLNLRINYVRDDMAARPELTESQLTALWETATSLVSVPAP